MDARIAQSRRRVTPVARLSVSRAARLTRAALLVAALLSVAAGAPDTADLVVVNAKVLTVDAANRTAQAVAIRNGRFVVVGTDAEARRTIGQATRVIDARGRTVIPGLIDSHVHALWVAAAEARQPFAALGSLAEIQAWIRREAARQPAGTWIWSPRIFPTRVRERRFPTRAELDAAAPDHPVAVDGAYAWMVNSAALRAAGITAASPDPPGGAIVKDASGAPTGLLRNVGDLLARFRGPADERAPLDMLERVHRAYNEVGITSVIERSTTVDGYRTYEALRRENRLHVRATVTFRVPQPGDRKATEAFLDTFPLKPREGDEWLAVGALKIFVDGGILAGTSFMREPYGLRARALYGVEDPQYRGFLTITREQIASTIEMAHARGWQVAAHVTGDAGVDAVLDAIEAAQQRHPSAGRQHTLIHAYFPNAETAARAARLGVVLDTQPAWFYKDADALADALGGDRLAHFIGLRTWRDAGVVLAINTDHMFGVDPDASLNPFNPFRTMAVAVSRRTEGGRVIGGDEAITREQALRAMTIDAARLGFDEGRKGSIEVGKLGDLAILTDDLLACPIERMPAIRAEVTVVGGRVVHERRPGRQP